MDKNRVGRILQHMKERHLRQILISDDRAIFYLTGRVVNPMERACAVLIQDTGAVHAFMNTLFCFSPEPGMTMHYYTDAENVYALIAAELFPGSVGFDDKWFSVHTISVLRERGDITPAFGSVPVDLTMCIKDEREKALLRAASRLNDRAVAYGIGLISQARTEQSISDALQAFYVENGAKKCVDNQLVCYGANAAEPHHAVDASTPLRPGDCVLLDIANPLDGYWCDMTRTVFYRSVSPEHRKVYETVRAAQQAGVDAVRPGVCMCAIDDAVRTVIEDAGYGKYFTHRTGHGVGLSVHEPPFVSATSDTLAQPGMCFSIEPGIYLPGSVGVRIEDLVLVTEAGCEVLNRYPKELQIVG